MLTQSAYLLKRDGAGYTVLLTEYTSGGAATTSYNVKIDFDGASWSEDLQAAFVATADYISSVILSDVSDKYADVNDGMGPRWFDDLEISAQIVSIDGVGGVLANAGPTYYRTAELIPFAGQMNFDSADAQRLYDADVTNGTNKWYDTVLHEMIHVLGFGTMWCSLPPNPAAKTVGFGFVATLGWLKCNCEVNN